jgi:uncharacterized protein with HEPN domain
MPRDSSVYLEDILTAAARIASYVEGLDRASFGDDPKTVDAVVRNPGDHRRGRQADPGRCPRAGAGLRDILIHAYFGIDLDIVWDVVTTRVPELALSVKPLLGRR